MSALFIFRMSNWLYRNNVPILPKILQLVIFFLFNSYIPYNATIGTGCRVGHRGIGVVINKDAILGNNVLIRAHVTIGKKDPEGLAPKIGDNVILGDGSKILGDVSIGNNVIVGANAVVVKDVPNYSVVGGVPAKIIGSTKNG